MHIGVSPETAADDACKIEHVISDESFEKMKAHAKKMSKTNEEKSITKILSAIAKEAIYSEEQIKLIALYLNNPSPNIAAKATWLIGEAGFRHPDFVSPYVPCIAGYLGNDNDLLRERALNALGRIGRADFRLCEPYFDTILSLSCDSVPNVRVAFIWACENIATNTPDVFKDNMEVFLPFLHDIDIRVRRESPEIFRVLGKRKPEYVVPYLETLNIVVESDTDEVVRIHANGAIKATQKKW